jgi:hypothetical protein
MSSLRMIYQDFKCLLGKANLYICLNNRHRPKILSNWRGRLYAFSLFKTFDYEFGDYRKTQGKLGLKLKL